MNVADIITELNNHGFEDTDNTQKMYVINDTLWDIESRQDWYWLIRNSALTFTGSSASPSSMPTGFKAVKTLYDTVNKKRIFWSRLDDVREKYGDLTVTGQPITYYFIGSTLCVYPVPPASSTQITMDYFVQQATLTSTSVEADINLPARHHRTIVLGAVAKLYQLEDDAELASVFKSDYEQRLAAIQHDANKFQFSDPDRIFVVDEDDEWVVPPYLT